MDEVELDATGMRCPMPIIEAARALRPLSIGDRLQIIATDPAFERDLRAFCEAAGHVLVSIDRVSTARWIARVEKGR